MTHVTDFIDVTNEDHDQDFNEDWVPEERFWDQMIDSEPDEFNRQLKLIMIRFEASFR